MMSSLFSIFDPSSSNLLSLNWMSILIFIPIINISYWLMSSNLKNSIFLIVETINKEIKISMGNNNLFGYSMIFVSLFFFIIVNNIMGLYPYIFTSSSHLSITLSIALPMWVSFMLFSITNHIMSFLSHLVPQGTPFNLMCFMVLIESISQIIRPVTLSVRLTANMIAGHLLMTLIGNQAAASSFMTLVGVMNAQIMLSILEMSVAMIQAYVFTMLMTLYFFEVNE